MQKRQQQQCNLIVCPVAACDITAQQRTLNGYIALLCAPQCKVQSSRQQNESSLGDNDGRSLQVRCITCPCKLQHSSNQNTGTITANTLSLTKEQVTGRRSHLKHMMDASVLMHFIAMKTSAK